MSHKRSGSGKLEKIVIKRALLKSPAYRTLKFATSFVVYADLLRKRNMQKVNPNKRQSEWYIKNDGKIEYPYSEAERQGISRQKFVKALPDFAFCHLFAET